MSTKLYNHNDLFHRFIASQTKKVKRRKCLKPLFKHVSTLEIMKKIGTFFYNWFFRIYKSNWWLHFGG